MEKIDKFLKERKRKNLLRRLRPAALKSGGRIYLEDKEYVDFGSNDYLALSGHPALKDASKVALDKFGTGASASRLLSGDLDIHHTLEDRIARLKGKESALIFNSGYQANTGIISALFDGDDVIFSDRFNHASIIDGILLSGARFFRFRHNDINHLEALIKRERHKFKNAVIISETIFSMDGDRPPLEELVGLKEKYGLFMMVDEAHATGVFGKNGSGIVEEEGLNEKIEFIMGTFSKALGSFGAYLACSKKVKEYLINACRGFIYSTALPPSVIAANLASLDLLKEEPFRRRLLLENADYFKKRLCEIGFKVKGSSQIVPLIIGDSEKTIRISQELQDRGNWVLPIRPPTVPVGESRLRLSLTYNQSKETLEKFCNDIHQIIKSI